MSEYILGVLGIVVSIGLFIIGYRQTIGAKKERVRSANSDVEKVLVRRIVLEGFNPRIEDVARLIDGKARDFQLRQPDLLSEEQILNNIFTRILETDFIPPEQRKDVLDRLVPTITEAEERPVPEERLEAIPSRAAARRMAAVMTAAMGIAASLVGSIIAVLPEIRDAIGTGFGRSIAEIIPMIVTTGAASLSIIAFMIIVYRIRERQQEEPSKASTLSNYVDFERHVAETLKRAKVGVRTAGPQDRGYDFMVEDRKGRKILVEVKAWSRPMPSKIVESIVHRLRNLISQENAEEAIIVTRNEVRVPDILREDKRIKIMTLREFKNYLASIASS